MKKIFLLVFFLPLFAIGQRVVSTNTLITKSEVSNPLADDGTALGTTSLKWSDLFLASGAVINFNSGSFTMTGGTNILTLGGSGANGNSLILPAGGTSLAPISFTTGGALTTTAIDGDIEMDANVLYATTDGSNRGYIPVRHYIRCNTTRTLPNDQNLNPIFNSPTNGRITLETGTYFFESMFIVTSMSATSGNALINLIGAGTAVVDSYMWMLQGIDNSTVDGLIDLDVPFLVVSASAASAVTAGTGTAMRVYMKGSFKVTTGGTFIPSIDQVTAASGVISIGSYFWCERIGSTSAVSVGQWD